MTNPGDGADGDGIGEHAALTTIMDTGAVGGIPIVRYIAGTVRDQSSGPIAPATAAIGAIVHLTTALQVHRS